VDVYMSIRRLCGCFQEPERFFRGVDFQNCFFGADYI